MAVGASATARGEELARLDAGYAFRNGDGRFPFRGQGIGVPSLEEVLARYPGVRLIIELKEESRALVSRTIDLITRARAGDRVVVGSFSSRALRAARQLAPGISTGAGQGETRWALYKSWVGWPLGRPAYREFQVPERSGSTRVVSRRFVERAHRAGVAVKVWTVNEPADIHRLLGWGVDAIITDRPDVAVPVVSARGRRRS